MTQALRDPANQVITLRQQLKDVDKALKFDTSNVDLLSQKQRLLTSAISSTEDELKILKEAQRQYIESGKDIDGKEYTALEAKIAITEKALKNLQAQQSNFSAELQAMGIKLSDFGQKATKLGTTITKTVTTAVMGAGTAAVAAWKEFDSAYDAIAAGTGATGSALAELKDNFDNVYGNFPASSEDVATAIADINTRFGFTGQALEDASQQFLKFARVNSTDVSGSIENVAKAMFDAGIDGSELNTVLDKLTVASQASGMSVDDIASALSKNGVAFRELGYNTDEVIALLTTFEKQGVDTSTMLTGMKAAFKNAAKEGKDAKSELKNLFNAIANGSASAADAQELFGTKAGAAIYQYAKEGKLNISEMMSVIEGSADGLEASFSEMTDAMDDGTVAINNTKLAAKEIGTTIMQVAAPYMQKLAEKAKEAAAWFSNLDDSTKETIVKIGALAAVLGPTILVVGKLASGVGAMIKYFGSAVTWGGKLLGTLKGVAGVASIGAGSILAIVGAIAAVVGAFATLWNTNKKFRDGMISIWNNIVDKVKNFCQGIVDRVNQLGFNFKDITEMISTIWINFCNLLAPVFTAVWKQVEVVLSAAMDILLGILDVFIGLFTGNWTQFWSGIDGIVDAVFEGIRATVENVLNAIINIVKTFLSWFGIEWDVDLRAIQRTWENIWKTVKDYYKAIIDAIKLTFSAFIKLFQGDWKGFCSDISKAWSTLWNGVKNFAQSIWNGIKSLAQSVWNAIAAVFSGILNTIQSLFSGVWNGITNFLSGIWNKICSMAGSIWNTICSVITNPVQTIYNTVSSIFNGIYNTIQSSMQNAANFISGIINTIKGFFNFKISWPKIPLPHFSISPRGWQIGDLLKGVIPGLGIEWYAKAMNSGMILNRPTVFGMANGQLLGAGEAGAEVVVGASSLDTMIAESVDRSLRNALELSKQSGQDNSNQAIEIDYDRLASAMRSGLEGVQIEHVTNLNGKTVAKEITPFVDSELERRKNRR